MSSSSPSTPTFMDTKSTIDPSKSKRPSREVTKYSQATLKNSALLVTLFSGDDTEKLVVHKDFACHYSPVLRAAFNSGFIEGQTLEYRLQDTTVDAIRQLINWFYTQRLDITCLGPDGGSNTHEAVRTSKGAEDMTLVELWVLAESLLLPRLQNLILEELERLRVRTSVALTSSVCTVAYQKTEEASVLRRYIVATCDTQSWIRDSNRNLPKEMLRDIVISLQDALPKAQKTALKSPARMAGFRVAED